VFISHTFELRKFPKKLSYVAAVERAVSAAGHVIVDMKDFPAANQPPAQLCAERVRACDVYVGVLGTRYGSPVRDKPEVSYTELEFDTATQAALPRLVFLLDTDAEDIGIPASALIDREFGARQDEFRRRVQDGQLTFQLFSSPAELGQLAERSLRKLAEAPRLEDNRTQGKQVLSNGIRARLWRVIGAGAGTGALDQPMAAAEAGAPIVARRRGFRGDGKTLSKAAGEVPRTVQADRARASRVLDKAARIAQFVTKDSERASTLAFVAEALTVTDPGRAARLFDDAERIAESISDERPAATSAVHGESSFQAVADRFMAGIPKACALEGIATALATSDLDRAERIAQSITDALQKEIALSNIAVTLAATDPDRAERTAQSIKDDKDESWLKARALAHIATAVAATDPDRAERTAQSITPRSDKAVALGWVAEVIATTDPDRAARLFAAAERTARAITDDMDEDEVEESAEGSAKASAFNHIARALAATDPDRAERMAQSITAELHKTYALICIASTVAATDPDRAARLFDDAERAAQSAHYGQWQAETLARIASAVVTTDLDRAARLFDDAERIAQSITDERSKSETLTNIVKELAASDPDRAERIAQSISVDAWKAKALVAIAKS
jgi:hypothetical protein